MPHTGWSGGPHHRIASTRSLTVATIVATASILAACVGDDDTAADEAPATTIGEADGNSEQVVTESQPATSVAVDPPAVDPPADDQPLAASSDVGTEATTAKLVPSTTPLAGVDVPADDRCGTGVGPSGPVELVVWHGLSGDAESYLAEVALQFESEHPGFTIELVKADTESPGGIEEFAALAPDDRPDAMLGPNMTVRAQADSGLFIPVESCAGGETPPQFVDLLPVVDTTYRVDGTLWAAPYNVSTPLLMYDGSLWRQAGLDPADPPTTIDELIDTTLALDASGLVETGLVLYDKSALWLITETAAKEGRVIIEPANGHGDEPPGEITFATREVIALLAELRELKRTGHIHWAGLNADATADLTQLIVPTDRSGMTLHTSASLGDIFRIQENGEIREVEVTVAPLPGPGPGATAGGGAWWLVDHDDADRVAGAWRFIDWITQPERVAELAAYTGYVPSTETAAALDITADSWAEHPQYKVAYDQVAATPGTPAAAGLQVGPLVAVFRAIELGAAYTIDGGNDPAAEMAAAVENVRNTLDVYAAG